MKKLIFPILYGIIFLLSVTGCGAQNSRETVQKDTEITLETTTVDGQEYYLLASEEDLLAIGDAYPLSGSYLLANDIAMSGEWEPLGSSKNPFTGIFDGNGHIIDGLTAAKTKDPGFFGFTEDAVIRNVVLENANFDNIDSFFPMVHHSVGTEIEGCSINAGAQE